MRKRLFKGDHPDVAISLNNLAACTGPRGSWPTPSRCSATPWRCPSGCSRATTPTWPQPEQPGWCSGTRGSTRTPSRCRDALEMHRRLFKGDHPDVAVSLSNLAGVFQAQGKLAEAEPLLRDALAMSRRLVATVRDAESPRARR